MAGAKGREEKLKMEVMTLLGGEVYRQAPTCTRDIPLSENKTVFFKARF